MVIITISVILLVVDNPTLDPNSDQAKTVQYWDRIISIIFAVEAILRIFALGFCFGQK